MSNDLIRRQDAIDAIHSDIKELDSFAVDYGIKKASIRRAEWRISQVQQVDAVEVKHGEWIGEYDGFDWDVRCSVCGEEALIKEGGSHDHAYSNYCPNCGSKMSIQHNDSNVLAIDSNALTEEE